MKWIKKLFRNKSFLDYKKENSNAWQNSLIWSTNLQHICSQSSLESYLVFELIYCLWIVNINWRQLKLPSIRIKNKLLHLSLSVVTAFLVSQKFFNPIYIFVSTFWRQNSAHESCSNYLASSRYFRNKKVKYQNTKFFCNVNLLTIVWIIFAEDQKSSSRF